MSFLRALFPALTFIFLFTPAHAQQVSSDPVSGITNLKRLESTVACAGATTPESMRAVKEMGFASVVNLREASEPGANVEAESAAAKAAGLRYVHLPLNRESPEPAIADRFLIAARDPANPPSANAQPPRTPGVSSSDMGPTLQVTSIKEVSGTCSATK